MGAPNLSLAEIPAADLEFVGLNGRPSVDCGFSLPIVRHKPTNRFALLERLGSPLRWDTPEVIDEFESLGRLTRLETPFPLPGEMGTDIYYDQDTQPVVVWVTPDFLGYLDAESLAACDQPAFQRVHLPADSQVVRAFFWLSYSGGITGLFNHWANTLVRKFDAGLTLELPDLEELERVADFGLCAARAPGVRYALFVRYCAAMYFRPDVPPERAATQYRVFVRNEFKTVSWDRFRADMMFVLTRSRDRLEFDRPKSSGENEAVRAMEQRTMEQRTATSGVG